jgi:acyl-CoA hydrolase
VDAEDLISGESRYAASAYITYVALDRDGKPTAVPGIIPETDDELRRNREAKTRREARIKQDSI